VHFSGIQYTRSSNSNTRSPWCKSQWNRRPRLKPKCQKHHFQSLHRSLQ
jgi:hypothetical protein